MTIHKSVDMNVHGAGTGNDYNYVYPLSGIKPNPSFYRDSDTGWVRLWAWWWQIMEDDKSLPATPATKANDGSRLQGLDQQIQTAVADGRRVTLVMWTTSSEAGAPGDNHYRLPTSVAVDSVWGRWVRFLIQRYRAVGGLANTHIEILEICNEPNEPSQVTAQIDASGAAVPIPRTIAQMFQTAQAISAENGHPIFLAGPGTDDKSTGSPHIPYDQFTDQLLGELANIGFRAHSKFIWTQHNYTDVESDTSARSTNARNKLVGRWAGYSEGNGPMLFITEGGARLSQVAKKFTNPSQDTVWNEQARLVNSSLARLDADPNVGMASNYLFFDIPNPPWGDAGLIEPTNGWGPIVRPAFRTPGWSSRPQSTAWLKQFVPLWEDLGGWYQYDPAMLSMHANHLEWFAVGNDHALYNRWWFGSSWGGPMNLGGYCTSAPAAISRADGLMDIFVVSSNNQLYTRYYNSAGWNPSGWGSLGGTCTSAPAACSWASNHIQIFVRSIQNVLWSRQWTSTNGWGAWAPLGGNFTTSPAAVSTQNLDIDVFGGENGVLKHRRCVGGYWDAGWTSLDAPPGGVQSAPTATSWSSTRVDVFVTGANGVVWRRYRDNGTWSAWEPISTTTVNSAPAAVSWHVPGRIDLVARRGNNMFHTGTS